MKEDDSFQAAIQQTRRFVLMKKIALWGIALLLLLFLLTATTMYSDAGMYWLLVLMACLVAIIIGMGFESARQHTQHQKLHSILVMESKEDRQHLSSRAIGPLLEVALSDTTVSDCLLSSTTRLVGLLNAVQEKEQVILTAHQRHLLHRIVRHGWWDWEEMMRAGNRLGEAEYDALRPPAIHALGTLGDTDTIPVLKRFARGFHDPKLRASALRSIEQIRERLRCRPEHLLRSSDAPSRPATLLRPALPHAAPDRNAQQLLRPDTRDFE